MATQYQLPALTLNFVDASGGEQTSLVRAVVQGDKGKTQLFSLWNGTAQWTGQPSELGFEASKPDGNFVDVRSGYDQAGTGFMLTIPDETFTKDGRVICHVYAYDSDGAIKAQSQAFTYDVKKVLYYDGTSNSISKDLEGIIAQAKADLTNFEAKITAVSTDDVIKATQTQVLADIAAWETSTKNSIMGDFATLKDQQQKFVTIINNAQATYESLSAKALAMDSATDEAKKQAGVAKDAAADAVQAKEDAEEVTKTTKAAGDEAAEQAGAAKAAAKVITDQKAAIDTANASLTSLQTKIDAGIDTVNAATITDADLATWIKEQAGE